MSATTGQPDDPWRCGVCGRECAVPSLARACEAAHETGHPLRAEDAVCFIRKHVG
ncbi:hypothetical protein [Peterkaempfera griseoplana]|uniref:hypothetical protein n=1 Tax=Peterkaempfera griseoplana TaxID=66896 RepID=UPI000AF2B393|nr:hypothetical protein [Peterkaempfera griseoplana]